MFLTIIIRVYNREDTIYRCIMSVINQTYIHKLQILIINDCSTEKTINIINEIKNKYFFVNKKIICNIFYLSHSINELKYLNV